MLCLSYLIFGLSELYTSLFGEVSVLIGETAGLFDRQLYLLPGSTVVFGQDACLSCVASGLLKRNNKLNKKETMKTGGYSYGLLDEGAKKEIRRSLLKALCVPGYQVPFASREMPIARGFGTGGLQITLSLLGPRDVLKVIDQGADESVNAASLRDLVGKVCANVVTTTQTDAATVIQTRHRIMETPLQDGQIVVYQVPYPDALGGLEPNEQIRVLMHGEAEYAPMYVRLYEDVVRAGRLTQGAGYPVAVNGHYVMNPSPIPRWDVPQLHQSRAMHLFGAGREKKIYAVPPWTDVRPLEFEDVRFMVETFADNSGTRIACSRCGDDNSYLDEVYSGDGSQNFQCSDTEWCDRRRMGRGDVENLRGNIGNLREDV